jgi:hypothetical protein
LLSGAAERGRVKARDIRNGWQLENLKASSGSLAMTLQLPELPLQVVWVLFVRVNGPGELVVLDGFRQAAPLDVCKVEGQLVGKDGVGNERSPSEAAD